MWGETNWRGFLKREMSVAEGGSYICIKRVSCYRVIDRRPVKECDGSQGGFTANPEGVDTNEGKRQRQQLATEPTAKPNHSSATAPAIISRANYIPYVEKRAHWENIHNAHLTILHRVLSNSDDRGMQ